MIHIEGLWAENLLTAEGQLLHENAHDPFFTEKRQDALIVRDMAIYSSELGASGNCDVVEFSRDSTGVTLSGRDGLWLPRIVEYKRGRSKDDDWDRLQLTAQAMCLEEMLSCPKINESYLYYGETRRREPVELTGELRGAVRRMFAEMREYYNRRHTPRVKPSKSCGRCSLNVHCLPGLLKQKSVAQYINAALAEGAET